MSDDEANVDERDETEEDSYIGSAWIRYLPPAAEYFLIHIHLHGPLTLDALAAHLAEGPTSHSLTDTAWEPETWTAQERQNIVDSGEKLASLEELNAEAERELAESIARFATYTDALGIQQINTLSDALAYVVACQYVTATVKDGETWYELNPHPPLPSEVLPLSEEERRDEDRMRWEYLNEPTASAIFEMFRPHEANPLKVIRISLEQLARDLDVPVDDARAGLAYFLEDPDCTATEDPETVDEREIFEIRVDW